jgi:SAM-dependent methyltransferase
MPILKLKFARGLTLVAGVTRQHLPDLEHAREQSRQLEQARKRLSDEEWQTVLWEAGKENEVEWWQEWLGARGQIWRPEEYESALDPEQPIQDYIIECLDAPPGATVSILDVGAGPLTKVGKRWEGRTVQVTAVDPLADQYERLLADRGITPLVRTQPGEVERLTVLFPLDKFDLVHMQNALDHSRDPLLGMRQMLDVVRPGGCVLLPHFVNEAENGNYVGLHQWNFCAENGHFVIWNRKMRISVNDALSDIAHVTVKESEAAEQEKAMVQGEILATLRKK